MTTIVRALKRADFPLKYSSGFHPAPRLSFGPALGVGIAGLKEYFDLDLTLPFSSTHAPGSSTDSGPGSGPGSGIDKGMQILNEHLPAGITVKQIVRLSGREKSLNSFIIKYVYELRGPAELSAENFFSRDEIPVERKKGTVNIKKMIEAVEQIEAGAFRITVRDCGDDKVRLDEMAREIVGLPAVELDITRIALYGLDESGRRGLAKDVSAETGRWIEPLEMSAI
jgi:hypothetical protein